MADREPRRRKKRKDSSKKEDIHMEEAPTMAFHKSESRDSDQDVEEDIPAPPCHEPSQLAQIVFIIFFLALAGLMCSVFIALHGSRSSVDVFNGDNAHDDHEEVPSLSDMEADHAAEEDADEGEELDILPDLLQQFQASDSGGSPDTDEITNVLEEEIVVQPTEAIKNLIEDDDVGSQQDPDDSGVDDLSSLSDNDEDDDDEEDEVVQATTQTVTSSAPDLSTPESVPSVEDDDEDEAEPEDFTNDPELSKPAAPNVEYENADITNEADYGIRNQLDEIDKMLEKSLEISLQKYEEILKTHPSSCRAMYGRARALDLLADKKRSNKVLEEAIASYQDVMSAKEVPDKLYLMAGNRCVERMQFRGFVGKSLKILLQMATRFPQDVDIKNRIAVGYLLLGRNKEAKTVFMEVLKQAPDNGFAKVHLGFILKTDESEYEEAIKLMSEGIQSREQGVIDGRFYLHLGDALARTNKKNEAMKVYEEGVKEGVFFSVYQRSLYNVKGLTGKPWWEPSETIYASYFKVLENNWAAIKNEALALISKKKIGFEPENEGLQDKGDWKQFDLFARGRKVVNNCEKAPFTCSLIEKIPDAATCKRGQAKFSIMKGGTHVWAHNGPTNCRLRSHLGLVTPPGARIRVANETRTWKEGKIILFDDSFEHEVWHDGTSERLVLIVDFWHPELSTHQKSTLSPI